MSMQCLPLFDVSLGEKFEYFSKSTNNKRPLGSQHIATRAAHCRSMCLYVYGGNNSHNSMKKNHAQ